MSRNQKSKLLEVFANQQHGFLEWLGGTSKGWRLDCSKEESVSWKQRFVIQLNTFECFFTLFASPRQKFYLVEEKKRMV